MISNPKEELATLADLKQLRNNARRRTLRSHTTLVNSLEDVGPARSGVIDENNEILAGNGTAEALAEIGITKVRIVNRKPDEWVVVRVEGLTEEQKQKLALYDNRSSELSEWDYQVTQEQFKSLLEQGVDLTRLGWLDYESSPILAAEWKPQDTEDLDGFQREDTVAPIKVSAEQREQIEKAVTLLRKINGDEAITEGEAVALIAGEYYQQHRPRRKR